ncbi:n-alkane-inducible cytochrome p450 [Fusarium flagelliforme]|uniref:N-alkane-inducible cytochrome p450 n=1 Tax=Fusarium flagelliforme TaxID=2675880 RepID=A0A395MTG1_9HYPO|nr:n-alkane-inducible cytochrome p450 [Fusarium flagelliforme]
MFSLLFLQFLQQHFIATAILLFLPIPLRALETYFRRWRLAQAQGCQDATSKVPVKDPIVGFDFLYKVIFGEAPEQYLDSTWQAFKQMGTTYIERRWSWQCVYTCDPQNLKQILATTCEDFDLPEFRTSVIGNVFGQGIFVLSGHTWKHARQILRQSFRKDNPAPFLEALERNFQAFSKHVPTDGSEVDLQPLFLALTMDVSTEFLMGHSTNMLSEKADHTREQQFVDDYMICSEEIIQQMQLGPLHRLKFSFAAERAKKRVYEYLDAFIEESLNSPNEGSEGTFLTDMMAVVDDRKGLSDHILHILLASRDTTSSLLSNLFFFLAKNRQIYTKLRDEVIEIAGQEPPTASQLKEMTYLKWCVNESLRLHPVIPTNARVAVRDTTIPRGGGADGQSPLFIPKGTAMFYNVYAMHRNQDVFGPEPEEFVPERWQDLRPGWGYLPFNGGARACIGQQYALLETHYVVARMAQTYSQLESRDDQEWMELYALALCSKNGTRVAARI